MTYRRLYLYLLLISTLLLAGLWWLSLRGDHVFAFTAGMNDGEFITRLYQSTISFRLSSYNYYTLFDTCNITVFPLVPAFTGGYDFVGSFGIGRNQIFGSGTVCYLEFPIWVPWLLLVAGGAVFVRVMDGRSRAEREKQCATRAADGVR